MTVAIFIGALACLIPFILVAAACEAVMQASIRAEREALKDNL